jgi:hypothetical protein
MSCCVCAIPFFGTPDSLFASLLSIGVLGRSPTTNFLLHDSVDGSDTHVPLTVTSESIRAAETIATEADEWFLALVSLCMALKVVTTNEFAATMKTFVLAVIQVSLNMRLNIFTTAKAFITVWVPADELVIAQIRTLHVRLDVVHCDSSLDFGCVNVRSKVQVGN